MVTLHLSISNGTPFIWVEQGRRISFDAKGKEVELVKHDFSPSIKTLAEALDRTIPGLVTQRRHCVTMHAWLPAVNDRVLPSSPLMGAQPDNGVVSTLKPTPISARPLNGEELLQLAAIAANSESRPEGVLLGSSILWTAKVSQIALDITLRQRVLPELRKEEKGWAARWRPVLDAEHQRITGELAQSMPAALRCLSTSSEDLHLTDPNTELLTLLGFLVDVLMRDPLHIQERVARRRRKGTASLHDTWLEALIAKEAGIQWPVEEDIATFASQLEQWRRPVDLSSASPFVMGLKLQEPSDDESDTGKAAWKLEYNVRPRSDPSLRLPLANVWRARSKAAQRLQSFGPRLTEYVLTALAQITVIYPDAKRSLRSTRPTGMTLDSEGALDFLRAFAPLLQEAGYEILYPSWWTRQGSKKRVTLRAKVSAPKSSGPATFSLDSLLDFSIAASIGDESVSLEELYALAELKSPLIRMRGQWVHIDTDEIQAVITRLEQRETEKISARDALRLSLGVDSSTDGVTLDRAELSGWIEDIASILSGNERLELLSAPSHFHGTLRPYQQRGYSWLAFLRRWGLGACLADDMGLGKTVQTLAMLQRDGEAGEKRPTLLICPTTVVNNWVKEAERFTPSLYVLVHHGSDRHREKDFLRHAKKSRIVISSYGLLHRDMELFSKVSWAGVILDEAQNIKNHETKQARAARAIGADYRIALTGTPVENSVGDLWSLMDFLNPGLLGGRTAFRRRFQDPIQRWGDQDAASRLRMITGPFILRREKTDKSIISDLPDKIVKKEYCPLTPEQASLYEAAVSNLAEELRKKDGMERRGLMLATLLRLKQICNHPAHFLGDGSEWRNRSGKLRRLIELASEIRQRGERTLVFTQFKEMGLLLQQAMQEQFAEEALFLHGGLTRKRRDAIVERFQSDAAAPSIFILSVKAGGTGLTLTRANHVVHYDRWWNPAVENQATDRAFRIGQKKNVQVHTFVVAGTLEERIDEMLERKQDIADTVITGGEQWLTEMSNESFLELVRLEEGLATGDED